MTAGLLAFLAWLGGWAGWFLARLVVADFREPDALDKGVFLGPPRPLAFTDSTGPR